MKVTGKIGIFEPRRVVFLHELDIFGKPLAAPPVPEPFAVLSESGYRKDPPVHKNPDLAFVIPLGQGSGIQTGPVFRVTNRASSTEKENDES